MCLWINKLQTSDILENDHKIRDTETGNRSDNSNLNFKKEREEYFVSSQLIKHPRFYASLKGFVNIFLIKIMIQKILTNSVLSSFVQQAEQNIVQSVWMFIVVDGLSYK